MVEFHTMGILNSVILSISTFFAAVVPTTKFVEGTTGQPNSFLPSQTITQNEKTVSDLIYRDLFTYDIYGALVPDLAESWEISEDGKVYTITIKKDAKWTDGSEVTSNDLIYTAFNTPNLKGVGTDRINKKTVRYILPNKFSPFLSLLTTGVIKEGSLDKGNPLMPISNGEFKVVNIKRSGPLIKEITLLHENRENTIRKLSFRYYSNQEELVTAAKLGEIDAFLGDPLSNNASDFELQNFDVYKFPTQSVYYSLQFNFRDEEKALSQELRQDLRNVLELDRLVQNYGITAQGAISRSEFTDRELDFDYYDDEIEKDYASQTIRLSIPDLEVHKALAQAVSDIWRDKLGIETEIITYSPNKLRSEVLEEGDFEVLFYGQEVGRDPDRYVLWHSTQTGENGLNIGHFEQVRADRALEEGRNETDYRKRSTHYNEFQKVISEEVPAIFLYHPYMNYYVTRYVEGIGEKYTFTPADRFLDFSNWTLFETN